MPTAMPVDPLTSRLGKRASLARCVGVAVVVVGLEVDGALVDVAHHLHRQRRHAALGVTHGGDRRCRASRSCPGPTPADSAWPSGPGAPGDVVDGRVAVQVVLAHHIADARAAAAVRTIAAVVHRVDHAAMHRLEAVAHQAGHARRSRRRGLVEERVLDLGGEVNQVDAALGRVGDGIDAGALAGPLVVGGRLGVVAGSLVVFRSLFFLVRHGMGTRGARGSDVEENGRPWRCAG